MQIIANKIIGQRTMLGALAPGDYFKIHDDSWSGVVSSINQGEAVVRVARGGADSPKTTYWSLGTEVVYLGQAGLPQAPQATQSDDQPDTPAMPAVLANLAAVQAPGELRCAKCGQVCSSRSGLTLHSKSCLGTTTTTTTPRPARTSTIKAGSKVGVTDKEAALIRRITDLAAASGVTAAGRPAVPVAGLLRTASERDVFSNLVTGGMIWRADEGGAAVCGPSDAGLAAADMRERANAD